MASKNVEFLRWVEIFEDLPEAQLEKIAELLKERRYSENQPMFKQGDPGDSLYLIVDGRVKVFIHEGRAEKVLAFYGEGQVLGEMSLLSGEPRSATAVTVTDTRVFTLSKQDFDVYVASNVGVLRQIMRVMALRQGQTNLRLGGDQDGEVETSSKTGKVYTVFSPRGGSGKTTIAVNLGAAFAHMYPERACLFDLSLTFGHCPLFLNLTPKASVSNMSVESIEKMDREGMNYYLIPHESTLRVLAGSNRPEEGEAVTGDHVKAMLKALRRHYAVTVVDTASVFGEATIAVAEESDRLLMLCTPDLATLRDLTECQRILLNVIGLPREKLSYVMNHVLPFDPLPVRQFQQSLEEELLAEIPWANDLPSRAAVRGEAIAHTRPGSNFSKAVEEIARKLETNGASQKGATSGRRGIFARA